MSKISEAFSSGKVFMPYITGGDPDIETTEKLLYALYEAGAGIIEIGVPFSDPIAEGPVIEAASLRALNAGCTVEKLFDLVARVRKDIPIPLLFMTYYNPVFAYGVSEFTQRCADCGLDGLIVPDLPFDERDELHQPCVSQGIELISLIAPTSEERIVKIARHSGGFLYCVSSLGVTGERSDLGDSARRLIQRVRQEANIPCAVGFGISNPDQAREVAEFADGVIIGSAIVKIIAKQGRESIPHVARFAQSITDALCGVRS